VLRQIRKKDLMKKLYFVDNMEASAVHAVPVNSIKKQNETKEDITETLSMNKCIYFENI